MGDCFLLGALITCTFWRYTPLVTVLLYLFLCRTCWPPLLLCLLWSGHICCFFLSSSLLFNFNIWTLSLVVPCSPIFKISYFLHYLLSSCFYFFSYSILHYPTYYHLKFILGNWFSLYLLLLTPAVVGQMPRPFTISIYPPLFSFQFCSQFSKSMLLVEQAIHKGIVLGLKHHICQCELMKTQAQPRWLFRKNSIEFSVGLYNYLYKCLLVCVPISHDHMTLTNNCTYLT